MAGRDLMLPGDAFQWRLARSLYPVYRRLGDACGAPPPCGPLHDGVASPEVVRSVVEWMYGIDDLLSPEDFARRLELARRSNPGATLENLLQHFVTKSSPASRDVDKADALFLDYFYLYAPPSFHRRRVVKPEVEAVLEPVIRYVPTIEAPSVTTIDALITMVELSSALDGFGIANLTAKSAELRRQVGGQYFARQNVVSFTHLNYTLRRAVLQLNDENTANEVSAFVHEVEPRREETAPADHDFAYDVADEFWNRNFV